MRKLVLILLILALTIGVFGCGGSSKTNIKDLQLTDKKMEADSFGHPVVTGKIKNNGKDTYNAVLVKVTFSDADGKVLEENYDMFGPVEAGKEISFTLKGTSDFYSIISYNVWIDSAN